THPRVLPDNLPAKPRAQFRPKVFASITPIVWTCIDQSATSPAQEKAGRHCRKGSSAAPLVKSEEREICRCYRAHRERRVPANRFQTAPYPRSLRFAENIPAVSAAESRKY